MACLPFRLLRSAALATVLMAQFASCASPEPPVSTPWPAAACTALEFSPDATRLAVGEQSGTVRILDLATSRSVVSLRPGGGPVWLLRWSPDGRWLAFGDRQTGLAVIEPGRTPIHPRVLASVSERERLVGDFNTSGTLFAAGGSKTPLRVWRLPSGTEVFTGQPGEGIGSLAFSPSGDELAVGMKPPRIEVRVLSTSDWTPRATVATPPGRVFYRADGALQLLRDERHTWYVRLLRAPGAPYQPFDPYKPLTGERVPGFPQFCSALAVSRDGSAYVLVAGINGFLSARRFGDPGDPVWVTSPAPVTAVAISPDGRHWAAGCQDGTLRTGELPARKEDGGAGDSTE